MGTRIQSFDLLKCFAIFCVVWGHCVQYLHGGNYAFGHDVMFDFIYSFHMPLFMVVSGFFAFSALRLGIWDFLRKKFVTLIWPCVIWGSLRFGLMFIMEPYRYKFGWSQFGDMIAYSFWFLVSLFVCYLIAYIARRITRRPWLFALIGLCLSMVYENNWHVPFLYPFFLTGMALSAYRDVWKRRMKLLLGLSLVGFVVGLLFWHGEYTVYVSRPVSFTGWLAGETWLVRRCWVALFRFANGLCGSLSFFLIFAGLIRKVSNGWVMRYLEWAGRNTLEIYILQTFVFVLFAMFPPLENVSVVAYSFACPAVAVVCMVAVAGVRWAIGCLPSADAFLFGKKRKVA
jgi:fucose 4-O-acetylase-like acetyltransferase